MATVNNMSNNEQSNKEHVLSSGKTSDNRFLTVERYGNKSALILRGDRTIWGRKINAIGGRWNSRVDGGSGWVIDISYLERVKSLGHNVKVLFDDEDVEEDDHSENGSVCSDKKEHSDIESDHGKDKSKHSHRKRYYSSHSSSSESGSDEDERERTPPRRASNMRNKQISSDVDSDNEDVVTLSRRMRFMMSRMNDLERELKRKH